MRSMWRDMISIPTSLALYIISIFFICVECPSSNSNILLDRDGFVNFIKCSNHTLKTSLVIQPLLLNSNIELTGAPIFNSLLFLTRGNINNGGITPPTLFIHTSTVIPSPLSAVVLMPTCKYYIIFIFDLLYLYKYY